MKLGVTLFVLVCLVAVAQVIGPGIEQQIRDQSWLETAKEWQAALGIVGVALAALAAYLSTMMHEHRRKVTEARALAAVFWGEVSSHIRVAKDASDLFLPDNPPRAPVYAEGYDYRWKPYIELHVGTSVYDRVLADVGALPLPLAFRLLAYYADLTELTSLTKVLTKRIKAGEPYERDACQEAGVRWDSFKERSSHLALELKHYAVHGKLSDRTIQLKDALHR